MTLDPDAPKAHVFPHARTAIRAWWSHRKGPGASRPGLGEARGKGATPDDVLRVGEVLTGLGLLKGGDLTSAGKKIRDWAMGLTPRSELEVLAARVTRHLRSIGVVAPATVKEDDPVDTWKDTDGEEHTTRYVRPTGLTRFTRDRKKTSSSNRCADSDPPPTTH